jgi:hypothetical protein
MAYGEVSASSRRQLRSVLVIAWQKGFSSPFFIRMRPDGSRLCAHSLVIGCQLSSAIVVVDVRRHWPKRLGLCFLTGATKLRQTLVLHGQEVARDDGAQVGWVLGAYELRYEVMPVECRVLGVRGGVQGGSGRCVK